MRYDETMLIDDIKETLKSDENCKIKIICIETYFDVYERMKAKEDKENG